MIPFLLHGRSARQPVCATLWNKSQQLFRSQRRHFIQRVEGVVQRFLFSWVYNFPNSSHPIDDQHRVTNDLNSRLEASTRRPLLQFQSPASASSSVFRLHCFHHMAQRVESWLVFLAQLIFTKPLGVVRKDVQSCVLFCFVLFCVVLFCFVLICFVLFCF